MSKAFDQKSQRLVFYSSKADNPEFWTDHWRKQSIEKTLKNAEKTKELGFYEEIFTHWLPKDAPILEGGCGMGQLVIALQKRGYQVIGVEFSKETVQKSKSILPDLNVEVGDIFALKYPNNFFGAYMSLGVIEHFETNQDKAIKEANRVLKPGGIFLLSVPYFNPLRRLKVQLGCFRSSQPSHDQFYQYAFRKEELIQLLEHCGFQYLQATPYSGAKGMKDEFPPIGFFYRHLYIPSFLNHLLDHQRLILTLAAHMIMIIARKEKP